MDLKRKAVLVTGGGGMLGSYLIRYLLKNDYTNIHALIQDGCGTALIEDVKDRIELHLGNILDIYFLRELFSEIQIVFHCAGIISFHPRDFQEMKLVNECGTENIVNACLECGVDKLIHVSSVAAIGRIKQGQTIDENSKWEHSKYNSFYGVTKQLAEMQVWRGITEGLNAAIVNPSIMLGIGNWETGSTALFTKVAKGLKYYPEGITSLVDARDVARFMIKLLESNISGERFILSAENISFRHFFELIAAALNQQSPAKKATPLLREIYWRVEWIKSLFTGRWPLVTKETARQASSKFYHENAKSLAAFDFKYIPLKQSIEDIARVYLSANNVQSAPLVLSI